MTYKFCLISAAESKDSSKIGYQYAITKKDSWVTKTGLEGYLTAGYVKGLDYIVVEGVPYFLQRSYILMDEESTVLFIAVESLIAQDTKNFS